MAEGRRVTLVLCDARDEVLGALPSFTVEDPWWPEVQPVIAAARERFGVDVIVLRVLDVVSDGVNGGDVTYLAELVGDRPPDLSRTPVSRESLADTLRAPWA